MAQDARSRSRVFSPPHAAGLGALAALFLFAAPAPSHAATGEAVLLAKKKPLRPGMKAVFRDDVEVLSKPREGAPDLFGAAKGERVTVIQVDGDWIRVQDDNGVKGWVRARALERSEDEGDGGDEGDAGDARDARDDRGRRGRADREDRERDEGGDEGEVAEDDSERESSRKGKDRKKKREKAEKKRDKDERKRRDADEPRDENPEEIEFSDSEVTSADFDDESESSDRRGGDDDDEGSARRRRRSDDESDENGESGESGENGENDASDGSSAQVRFQFGASLAFLARSQDFTSDGSDIVGKYLLETSAPTARLAAAVERWSGRMGLGLEAAFTTTIGGDGLTFDGAMGEEHLDWQVRGLELLGHALYAVKESLDLGGRLGYRRTAITLDVSETIRVPSERLSGITVGVEATARRLGVPELDVTFGADALLGAELMQTEGLRHGDSAAVTAYRALVAGSYRLNEKASAVVAYTLVKESYDFSGESARGTAAADGTREDLEHQLSVGVAYRLP